MACSASVDMDSIITSQTSNASVMSSHAEENKVKLRLCYGGKFHQVGAALAEGIIAGIIRRHVYVLIFVFVPAVGGFDL
jgi:hypothetical protein